MPLDHYVTLGRSGLRVSPFALGAMTFGEDPPGAGCSPAESEKILATYLDLGGNFIDTANFYTNGHAEKILGDFFAAQPGRRPHVVLASKFFGNMFPGDPNGGGAGRTAIIAQLDESLRRLRTDYLDLYWLHNWDRNTPIEETMRTLDDQVRAGKVRYLGFSNTPAWLTAQAQVLAQLKGWTPLIALQVEYSLLARTVEAELAPLARDQGLALVPWSPLKNGCLSGKYRRGGQGDHVGGGVAGLAAGPRRDRGADRRRPAGGAPAGQPGRSRRDADRGPAPDAGRDLGAGPGLPGPDARRAAGDAPVRRGDRGRRDVERVSAAGGERRSVLKDFLGSNAVSNTRRVQWL
jgi:aryl-alcohol dehydrogenase-like predicted oxidoreductase